jgi:hypothetical protein
MTFDVPGRRPCQLAVARIVVSRSPNHGDTPNVSASTIQVSGSKALAQNR